jgi:uncharacterized protein (TIGR02001 family)
MAAVVLTLLMSASPLQAKEPDVGIPGAGELPEGESTSEPAPSEEPASEEIPKAEESAPGDWLPGTFSASVALTSNYVDRGISNTDNDPAIQGYLEYALETGLLGTSVYVSTFGSNAKLVGDSSTSHLELDAFFGVRGEIGETGVEWDLGGAYYSYPGTSHRDDFNYWEIPLIVTYDPLEWLEVQVSNWATPEYQFDGGTGNYTNGLITVTVPNPYVGLKAFGGVGYQYVERNLASGMDWTLGTTVSIKGIDFTLAYTDTNYQHRALACGGKNLCDAKAVFTVGAQF